jgi:hypothetical protein
MVANLPCPMHGSYDLNLGSKRLILVGDIRSRSWPHIDDSYGTSYSGFPWSTDKTRIMYKLTPNLLLWSVGTAATLIFMRFYFWITFQFRGGKILEPPSKNAHDENHRALHNMIEIRWSLKNG